MNQFLIILILFIIALSAPGLVVGTELMQPLVNKETEYRDAMEVVMMAHGKNTKGRRRLAPFQVCLGCRCCTNSADPTTCANMPCCYGIDCQLPNKPFGVCAFVPKTCNCTFCSA